MDLAVLGIWWFVLTDTQSLMQRETRKVRVAQAAE